MNTVAYDVRLESFHYILTIQSRLEDSILIAIYIKLRSNQSKVFKIHILYIKIIKYRNDRTMYFIQDNFKTQKTVKVMKRSPPRTTPSPIVIETAWAVPALKGRLSRERCMIIRHREFLHL